MRILYNIQDIQYAVDNIRENDSTFLPEDRLIKIDYEKLETKPSIASEDESRLTCWYSNQLSSLSCDSKSYYVDGNKIVEGCFNPLTRINRYLLSIRRVLTTAQQIIKDLAVKNQITMQLSSALDEVNSSNRIFSLTEFNEHTNSTFNLLSSFFDKAAKDVLTQKSIQGTIIDLNASGFSLDDFTSNLLNGQNCNNSQFEEITGSSTELLFVESDYLLKYAFTSSASMLNIIDSADVLYLLNMFIQNLKNTKYVTLSWNHKTSSTNTKLNAYANLLIKEFQALDSWNLIQKEYANFSKAGTNVSLTMSPWIKQSSTERNKLMLYTYADNIDSPLPQNYRYLDDVDDSGTVRYFRGIVLNNIIYDNSAAANILQNIPLSISGTNGIFGHELTVDKNDNFKLLLTDVQKQFGLFSGKIISRKSILNAIDYIFRYWLENMSTVSYKITTCHSNCHENTVASVFSTTVQKFVTGSVYYCGYLRYTSLCGCGNIGSFNVNLYNLIPQQYRTSDAVIGQKVYARFTKGGYYENKSALTALTVETDSSTLLTPFTTSNSCQYLQTGQNFTTSTITVSATRDTRLKEKEQYFCLQIELKAKYNYRDTADEDES